MDFLQSASVLFSPACGNYRHFKSFDLLVKGKQIELVLECKYLGFLIDNVFLLKLILSGFQTQNALFPFMK